ncbi:hypothetical protein TNIN_456421 [Trichonephila inaurata madagascariensis]|uniref:Uncharacterized protein n=1 Tax=Trichonephila inaurata madagascariensis TaxID=2747483 RepID=A0A8X6XC87_9ARAC|nr:hypothetical protein TNIN_456421 [Trichonephila inaurata madagascariensis]
MDSPITGWGTPSPPTPSPHFSGRRSFADASPCSIHPSVLGGRAALVIPLRNICSTPPVPFLREVCHRKSSVMCVRLSSASSCSKRRASGVENSTEGRFWTGLIIGSHQHAFFSVLATAKLPL